MTPDPNRCTGRTTRMFAIAKSLVAEGYRVFVIADNENHARRMREEFNCRFGWPAVLSRHQWCYDEATNTVLGAGCDAVVLLDHFAKECIAADREKVSA